MRARALAVAPLLLVLTAAAYATYARIDRAPRALALEDGTPLASHFVTTGPDTQRVVLSDRSVLALSGESELELGESSPRRIDWVLRRGVLDLDVRSAGQPAWVINCGWVTIEITGTRLSIERGADEVVIRVVEGTVRVTDEHLSPPVQYLAGPARLTVPNPQPAHAGAKPPAPPPPIEEPPPPPSKPLPRKATQSKTAEDESDKDLLERADLARAQGRPHEAVPILEGCIDRGGTSGALAAFTLGRIFLDDLAQPERATHAFERAIELPLPDELRESAFARIVEAHHRAGRVEEARVRGKAYLDRFPNGQYRARVLEWMAN